MSEPKPLLAPLPSPTTTPRLWTAGAFTTDPWRTLADEVAVPIDRHAIVSLARWRAERVTLSADDLAIGVKVAPADLLDPATDQLDRVGVIALVFPKFSDGRAYSTARRLREAWGYRGLLRATGDVLLDQLPLMLRAGFDAFEIVDVPTIAALEAGALPAVSRTYQRSTGGASGGVGEWNRRTAAHRLHAAE